MIVGQTTMIEENDRRSAYFQRSDYINDMVEGCFRIEEEDCKGFGNGLLRSFIETSYEDEMNGALKDEFELSYLLGSDAEDHPSFRHKRNAFS